LTESKFEYLNKREEKEEEDIDKPWTWKAVWRANKSLFK
jgi:hypothetical protein